MRKNEDILKKKCFYEDKVNNRNKDIENTQKENVELKEKKEKINNDKITKNNDDAFWYLKYMFQKNFLCIDTNENPNINDNNPGNNLINNNNSLNKNKRLEDFE